MNALSEELNFVTNRGNAHNLFINIGETVLSKPPLKRVSNS